MAPGCLSFLLAALLLVPALVYAQLAPPPPAPPAPPAPRGPVEVNAFAATVNGKVITKNQVSFMLAPIFAQLATQYPRRGPRFEEEFEKAKKEILQELIDRQIILDEFKQLGADIRPHIIEEEIRRQVRELYNGDEAKLREELKRSRMTMEGYREMTREKMVVQSMRAQQFSDAPPPLPDEVRKEFEAIKRTLRDTSKDEITFRKIFIPAADPENPLANPDSQFTLAEEVARKLSQGADFEELAMTHSRDAFAREGGLQENIPRTDLAPEFAAIIVDAPRNSVIGPLLDPQGFTIVRVSDVKYGPSPPLSDSNVRQMIEERVQRKKTAAQYERWIEQRRKRAMIDIRM